MTYETALAEIATKHRADIEADLVVAQAECDAAQQSLERAKRRVDLLCGLLESSNGAVVEARDDANEKLTLHSAMHTVLRESPTKKLRASEIIAEIKKRNLYRMKDGRLPESQQIHARASHYPHLFGKDGSFFYAK